MRMLFAILAGLAALLTAGCATLARGEAEPLPEVRLDSDEMLFHDDVRARPGTAPDYEPLPSVVADEEAAAPIPAPAPPARPAAEPRGRFVWPVASHSITSRFGRRYDPIGFGIRSHQGVDVSCAIGTPVSAVAPGEVVFAGWAGGRGYVIEIWHSGELSTVYAHLSRIDVQKGRHVRAGESLGLSGMSGRSTGPHLHLEVWRDGRPSNPLSMRWSG